MVIRIQVIKVYDVMTEGGDPTDQQSINEHLQQVENMQSTEIENVGRYVNTFTDYAEVIGPDGE